MVRFEATKFYGSMVVITGLILTLTVYSINSGQTTKTLPLSLKITPADGPAIFPTLEYIVISETPVPTATPKPTLTPTVTPKPLIFSDLDQLMERHARNNSISFELLKKIARCESGFNSNARNGDYAGLYQFSTGSWQTARKLMNENPDPNLRFNAEEAVKTAAFKIASGGIGIWPNCGK